MLMGNNFIFLVEGKKKKKEKNFTKKGLSNFGLFFASILSQGQNLI